jgi:transposase-like protein
MKLIHQEARAGAQRILQAALEAEVEQHIEQFSEHTDADGRQTVVKNGYAPARSIDTGVGSLEVRRPRVDERKAKEENPKHREFTSAVLPKFLRRTPTLDGSLATLYLLGVSTNDFPLALRSLLGEQADTISASTITRIKREWEAEYDEWRQSDLSDEEYAYLWADGIYFNVRLDEERSCILVVIGVNYRGEKKLLALQDGYRESKQSWKEALMSMKKRGLKVDPKLVIGDGGLGLWAALPEVFPGSATQRCWVHKTANVLDKMPKSVQARAKKMIHDIYMADTKENAESAFDHFLALFKDKYPKATDCLSKDREALMSFYRFPAKHWQHIRSTNVIESVFATVRLRTKKTKGCGSRQATLAMTFKLIEEAQKTWRKLQGWQTLKLVHEDRRFVDGELVEESAA